MSPTPGAAGPIQIVELFQRILNISVATAFIALTVMLLYAGFTYLTSAGDPTSTKKAAATITQALLGILYMALIWLALKLLATFTGVDLTHFCFGFPGISGYGYACKFP